jgi:hypothetical protein
MEKMSERKFFLTRNLNNLNEEERKAYYLQACEYFNLPPELNLLYLDWMESGDGTRNLVLAATKGATDIIRGRQGITTVDLKMEPMFGCVNFTAVGQNGKGRIERAIGSCGVDGLRGRALEVAIMTAQTRATRRMTLQFLGGGLLDETEFEERAIKAAPALVEVAPQIPPLQPIAQAEKSPYTQITGDPAKDFPLETRVFPTVAQIEAQKALAAVKSEVLIKESGESAPQKAITDAIAKAVFSPDPPFEVPKRRSRKKAEVSFEIPFKLELPGFMPSLSTAKPSIAAEKLVEEARKIESTPVVFTRIDPLPGTAVQGSSTNIIAQTPVPELKPEPVSILDATQIKGFRDRLFKYTNGVFPKAGMVPSVEGGGIAQKVRKYAQVRFNVPLTNLSAEQWESMFSYWNTIIQEQGPAFLVKIIDDVAEGKTQP